MGDKNPKTKNKDSKQKKAKQDNKVKGDQVNKELKGGIGSAKQTKR